MADYLRTKASPAGWVRVGGWCLLFLRLIITFTLGYSINSGTQYGAVGGSQWMLALKVGTSLFVQNPRHCFSCS